MTQVCGTCGCKDAGYPAGSAGEPGGEVLGLMPGVRSLPVGIAERDALFTMYLYLVSRSGGKRPDQ